MSFPVVSNFYIDFVQKFALVRGRKVEWENLFSGIRTKERVPIKTKRQLMLNIFFIQCILLLELATKVCMEKVILLTNKLR